MDAEAPAFGIWQVRAVDDAGRPTWDATVQSDRHPDATELTLPEAEALEHVGEHAVAIARYDGDGDVVGLEATEDAAPKAPPLWFIELRQPSSDPPAVVLVAMTGHGVAAGTLLNRRGAREVGVTSEDQLGAFRWIPHSGFGDQLYVSPDWRRRTIGTGLLAAANTLGFARGWPRLWGDGQRTAEGDRMRQAGRWTHLSEDLTHLMPPMTPPEQRR